MSEPAPEGMSFILRGFDLWAREIIRDALYEDLCLYDGWTVTDVLLDICRVLGVEEPTEGGQRG